MMYFSFVLVAIMPTVFSKVHDVSDAFAFPAAYGIALKDRMNHMMSGHGELELTTAFSGICTPSVSLHGFTATLPTLQSASGRAGEVT